MKSKGMGIIPPPARCKCGQPTALILIEVYDQNGRAHTKVFSEVRQPSKRGKRTRELLPQYRFKRWIAECVQCINHQPQQEIFG